MKPIWKLLALGITIMSLWQSCVTVHPRHRHHHRHRLCHVVGQPATDATLSNLPTDKYPVVSEFVAYGNNG